MRLFTFFMCILLVGCSTKPVVKNVTGKDDIDGVPFRLLVDQKVMIYKLKDDDNGYELVSSSNQRLPDFNNLYSLNFKGDVFATNSLHIIENSDNTLKTVELSSTDTTGAVLDSISSTIASKATTETTKKTSELTSAKAILDADKAVRDAQKDLDALPITASAEVREQYLKILESAKRQAEAARAL